MPRRTILGAIIGWQLSLLGDFDIFVFDRNLRILSNSYVLGNKPGEEGRSFFIVVTQTQSIFSFYWRVRGSGFRFRLLVGLRSSIRNLFLFRWDRVPYIWQQRHQRFSPSLRKERGIRTKGSGVTVLGGISSLWGCCRYIIADGTTTEACVQWLDSIKKFVPKSGGILVLDNHACHSTQRVQQKLWELKLTPLYVPPTASEFNCIEVYWSWFKQFWRKKVLDSSLVLDF